MLANVLAGGREIGATRAPRESPLGMRVTPWRSKARGMRARGIVAGVQPARSKAAEAGTVAPAVARPLRLAVATAAGVAQHAYAARLRPVLRDPRRQALARAQRVRRLPRRHRAGGPRRGRGLHVLLDRRAPLPLRILPLFRARGALRHDCGTDEDAPHRAWGPPPAVPLQPSDPRRRDGR